jgi:hypothetical protein
MNVLNDIRIYLSRLPIAMRKVLVHSFCFSVFSLVLVEIANVTGSKTNIIEIKVLFLLIWLCRLKFCTI